MLEVKTPEQVWQLLAERFGPLDRPSQSVPLAQAPGRVLAQAVTAREYVPDFDRSTVDGYAVRARDTFGCSDAIPAILPLAGEILMGKGAPQALRPETCWAVPTGGAIPPGGDCAIMVEYTEDYGDGTVGFSKSGAPGENLIFRGDDVYPGKEVLPKGRVLSGQDIGALAAIGVTRVEVAPPLKVAILSTGDELVPPESSPGPGQVRDVNGPMLAAMVSAFCCEPVPMGIVPDDPEQLGKALDQAIASCDVVLLSGGSSVGAKDVACELLSQRGELLLHGIAMKPGKPTLLAKAGSIPLVGLPGHPVAAYFVTRLFVYPLLARLLGRRWEPRTITARSTESISANHGRAQYGCVRLVSKEGALWAEPIRSKSGLITTLAGAEGFYCIPRDREGVAKGELLTITLCEGV